MKTIIINGSPRKNWNTHQLLLEAQEGAIEKGAETRLYNLYDIEFKDCRECFACKMVWNKTNGVCAFNDDLKIVLEDIASADALIIGSPVYYENLTGETISFLNRLLFPAMHYQNDGFSIPKHKKCALILTMNIPEIMLGIKGYRTYFDNIAQRIGRLIGPCETFYCCDTLQFTDYSKYYAGKYDEEHKRNHHKMNFPKDLQAVRGIGKRLSESQSL